MQEMHEQKMHFLHEFHRQEIHSKEREIKLVKDRAKDGVKAEGGGSSGDATAGVGVGGDGGVGKQSRREKQKEIWKLMGTGERRC